MCACGAEIEATENVPLHCYSLSTQRSELFDSFQNIDSSFLSLNVKVKVTILLYSSPNNTNNLFKD